MIPAGVAQDLGKSKPPPLARSNITACIRCRRKKKRCDQKLPRCSLCEIAGAECAGYDAVTKRHVPRSYVHSLEERVAFLESKLLQHGITEHDVERDGRARSTLSPHELHQPLGASPLGSTSCNRAPMLTHGISGVAAKATADKVVGLARREPQDEPTFSRILLTELMSLKQNPRIGVGDRSSTAKQLPSEMISGLDTSPVSLPTKEAAQNLVKAYFQFANLSLPLLHEPTLVRKLDLLYSMSNVVDLNQVHTSMEARIAVFFVFEVFAVALLTIQKQDPSRIPASLADRYHKTAVRALNEAGLPNDVEGVQALLLVGQYCYHHPTIWAVWKTVGAALRLAVELELHKDPPSNGFDLLTLDTRRRTFWVAYAMDRNISIALSMPSCLSDGAITAKFPSQVEDDGITPNGIIIGAESSFKTKRISTHVFRYRQIQSEMQTVLYETAFPVHATGDLSQWQAHMHSRIQAWYEDTPRDDNVSNRERRILENFELTFHRALFFLYHPSLNIPEPPEASLLSMTDAAIKMIELYRQFFRDHRLTIYWQAVENLSSAGTALMFSYVASPQVRDRLSLRSLESLVNICSSVLWGMVEHFPDFKGKRDAFDITASKVLADLCPSSQSSDAGRANAPTNDQYIDFNTNIEHNPLITYGIDPSDQHRTPTSSGVDGIAAHILQPQISLPETDLDHDPYTPQGEFSVSDFNDVSFDWEAFQSTSEFLLPTWT